MARLIRGKVWALQLGSPALGELPLFIDALRHACLVARGSGVREEQSE
jgi:hypothetical protein